MSAEPSAPTYTVPCVIGGKEYHPKRTFNVISPATGKLAHSCGSASVEDAASAVEAAAAAFPSWKTVPVAERRDIFLEAARIMGERRVELSEIVMSETGATRDWAEFNLKTAASIIKDIAGRIPTIEGLIPPVQDRGTGALVLREPYGVVLAMAPWNAPYILGSRSVAVPIAAGNTVVLKASEKSPRTMHAIVDVFRQAGLPDGVLNIIYCDLEDAAPVTTALIANKHVRKLNFTGSTAVGRIISKIAGEHLKPVVLELGGKASAVICEDADLDNAVSQCALGSFLNAGQICMSTERILVHKNIKAEFEKKFKMFMEKEVFTQESKVLIGSEAVDKNHRLLKDAVSKGATLLHGGLEGGEGATMKPVAVSNVSSAMDIYQTESFGPTVSIIETESDKEAINIANDTEYGLNAAVFTEDLRRGLRIARSLEIGAVHINGMSVHDESTLPHGGVKASGHGRFNATEGFLEWVKTKTITFNI